VGLHSPYEILYRNGIENSKAISLPIETTVGDITIPPDIAKDYKDYAT